MKWFKEMISDESGSVSSKRLSGVVVVFLLLLFMLTGISFNIKLDESWQSSFNTFLILGGSLLGVTEIRKFISK